MTTTPPLREIVSDIDTIWNLTEGRIPEKGERFIVREEDWDYTIIDQPVRIIRRIEIV